jgi:hypothetical protein
VASESALDLQAVPPDAAETIIALAHSINDTAHAIGAVPADEEVAAELGQILHAPDFVVSCCMDSWCHRPPECWQGARLCTTAMPTIVCSPSRLLLPAPTPHQFHRCCPHSTPLICSPRSSAQRRPPGGRPSWAGLPSKWGTKSR